MRFSLRKKGVWLGILLTPIVVALAALVATGSSEAPTAVAGSATAAAQDNSSVSFSLGKANARKIQRYWTAERLKAAKAYPVQAAFESEQAAADAVPQMAAGAPGGVNGSAPGGRPVASAQTVIAPETASDPVAPQHAGYPAPHTRWQYAAKYLRYPVSTVGKVFFTQDHDANGTRSNFVCSGATIGFKYVLTAGHCVNNGRNGAGADGGWSTNFQFCPSYDSSQGGVNPRAGCWTAYNLATSGSWFSSSNFDRDWGGAAMNLCSSRTPPGCTNVGTFAGWLGRAWNWQDEHFIQWGYPAASPFTGGKLITNAAEHAYTINQGAGADSKYTGNDMTGGSSGGPWVLFSWTNNWADGVNSHKRCTQAGCPPGSVLTQEMGSPPFTTEAGGSEDFFAFLFTL